MRIVWSRSRKRCSSSKVVCKIITLIDSGKGEQTAHTYVIACFRQLSAGNQYQRVNSSAMQVCNMHTAIRVVALVLAILSTTECSHHSPRKVESEAPARVLFDRAKMAMQEKRFAVANLTLQTLVNTYPDSQHADQAKLMLQDPQIARCSEGFSTTPNLCEPKPLRVNK